MVSELDALIIPPKSIWDPSDDGKSTKSGSPRKHPSDMDEIELRVQLWDSYRLARIILGIPIKSFSLKSKTILHAIRIVAEMKLELIRLQKELDLARVENDHSMLMATTITTENGTLTTFTTKSAPTSPARKGILALGGGPSSPHSAAMASAETHALVMAPSKEEVEYKLAQEKQNQVLESTRVQLESLVEKLQNETSAATNTTAEESANAQANGTSNAEELHSSSSSSLNAKERSEILEMVEALLQKVQDTTEATNAKFQQLQEQIRLFQQQNPSRSVDIDTLNKKLRTRQTIHSIEIESSKAKHLQQVMDMSGQLESYKEQVERQQEALMELNAKYEELESMAVTSEQAKEVLKAIEYLEEHNSDDDDHSDSHSMHSARERVQAQVIEILKRMAVMHSRNQREKQQLENLLKAARKKEMESEEELAHLNLQMELLEGETKVPPDEFAQNMAYQRLAHKRQLTEILKREEKRLLKMEYLEVRLTELAFMAVEIEDLQKEAAENEQEYKEEIAAFRAKQLETSKKFKSLKQEVAELLENQKATIDDLDTSIGALENGNHQNVNTSNGNKPNGKKSRRSNGEKKPEEPDEEIQKLKDKLSEVSRVRRLEEELAKRDEELARVRNELRISQLRVADLEKGFGKYPSDSECTSPLSSRSST